jgi:hypothetical protein
MGTNFIKAVLIISIIKKNTLYIVKPIFRPSFRQRYLLESQEVKNKITFTIIGKSFVGISINNKVTINTRLTSKVLLKSSKLNNTQDKKCNGKVQR